MNKSKSLVKVSHLAEAFRSSPGKTFLLYGDERIFPLTMKITAYLMLKQRTIAVVDGCNSINIHALARFAQERTIDPESFLKKIFISRGFTCYQIEQAVVYKLPDFLKKIHSQNAIILGLLETLYDEQAPIREVRQILGRVLAQFAKFKEKGITLLVACQKFNVVPEERNQLFHILLKGVDSVYSSRRMSRSQCSYSKKEGTMGRSVATFTNVIDEQMKSWSKFRRGLRKEDQEVFDEIFLAAKRHLAENFYAMRAIPFESIVMSILIEYGKEIKALKQKVQALEEKTDGVPQGMALRSLP